MIEFVHHSVTPSPHMMPLMREVVSRLGAEKVMYLYDRPLSSERMKMGWRPPGESWVKCVTDLPAGGRELLKTVPLLYSGIREFGLFEERARKGLKTAYTSERWFRPLSIIRFWGMIDLPISGWGRMCVPCFRRMAKDCVRWIQNDPNGYILTIGPWAKKDMLRLGVPEPKIIPWGYFVSPSTKSNVRTFEHSNSLKVLWVGRMLDLKRVDTIIRAIGELCKKNVRHCSSSPSTSPFNYHLTLVGDGPEKPYLQRLATRTLKKINTSTLHLHLRSTPISITFLPSQPIEKIRSIMREHDVFVFASDATEGWGAVVSEALEEGMTVIGTYEAGASATMLPDSCLYHAGDYKRLALLLEKCVQLKIQGQLRGPGIGDWSAARAADRLLVELG